jgi:hypothetical protein
MTESQQVAPSALIGERTTVTVQVAEIAAIA